MKTIFKRITAVTTAAVLFAASIVFDVPKQIAEAAEPHQDHAVCINSEADAPGCSHMVVSNWIGLKQSSIPTKINKDQNYYLTEHIALERLITIEATTSPTVNVNICLNGYSITSEKGFFEVYSTSTLNICDCSGGGKLICPTGSTSSSAGITIYGSGQFNMYSGGISGNTATNGGGVYNGSTFTIDGTQPT